MPRPMDRRICPLHKSGRKPFYILTGKYENHEPEATDTDLYWNAHGYGSVVPVIPDLDYSGPLDI